MEELKEGDIVQINPECGTNSMFGGCLMVVTEPKSWGAQGYVQALGQDGKIGGQAYIRLKSSEFERTGGRVVWTPRD